MRWPRLRAGGRGDFKDRMLGHGLRARWTAPSAVTPNRGCALSFAADRQALHTATNTWDLLGPAAGVPAVLQWLRPA